MPRFDDMRLRVINTTPCDVELLDIRPECLPYGKLFFFPVVHKGIFAIFGDLTMRVSNVEMFELLKLAGVLRKSEWQCPQCSV